MRGLGEEIVLSRDCPAIQIPNGDPITLPKGMTIALQQSLGDTYTVYTAQGFLVRIAGEDADAIGKQPTARAAAEPDRPIAERIEECLRSCYDPEIPVNIVDLGLIYDRTVGTLAEGGYQVDITMTLTAPGCGMGEILARDVREKLLKIPDVRHVDVQLVFEPPWNPSRMTEAAQLQLGMM